MDSTKITEDAGIAPDQATPDTLTADQPQVALDQAGDVTSPPHADPEPETAPVSEPSSDRPEVREPGVKEPMAEEPDRGRPDEPTNAAGVATAAAAPDSPDAAEDGFADLGLAPAVAQAVIDLGYETATAVQRECIPHLLAGRDLLGQAQTGTGKTAAFALPLLSRLDANSQAPQVLVLTPTRELALQVAEAFQRYAHNIKGFHVLPIYGGQSYGLQVRQLQRIPQVIVGTPGRVMDHMRRATLSLDSLKALVLDEADEMLNMGFSKDIDWIFEHTPPDRQVALFSATMPPEILRVARDHLNDPVEVRIHSATATVDTIDQQHCVVTRFHKADVLTRILELETFDAMLIFVRTKGGTTELADKLRSQGFAAEPLSGDMNQEMRERTVDRLKRGLLDILVATDVAARGLDVERISHVVNFDIPTDPSSYVHRIGRTGRAGRAGKAILLVEPRERGLLRSIERTIRRSIPEMDPPSAAQLSATRIDRFTVQLRETLAEQDLDFFYRLIARIEKDQELNLLDIAAAASYLIQRERPLDVKETPRPPPRDNYRDRDGGYERPRRQEGARDSRPYERPADRGPGRDRDDRRPRPDREAAGGERRFDNRADRPAPSYNRERPRTGTTGRRAPNGSVSRHRSPIRASVRARMIAPTRATARAAATNPASTVVQGRPAKVGSDPSATPGHRSGIGVRPPSVSVTAIGNRGTTSATTTAATASPRPSATGSRNVKGPSSATSPVRTTGPRASGMIGAIAIGRNWSSTASRSDTATASPRARSSAPSPTRAGWKGASSGISTSRTITPSSICRPGCRARSSAT